jgi:hypothetical protein
LREISEESIHSSAPNSVDADKDIYHVGGELLRTFSVKS